LKAEILYIAHCPNRSPARRQVERLLAEHGVQCLVDEVEVADTETAERLGFAGSPTIRIDGRDVSPLVTIPPAALACRTYAAEGRFFGIPPDSVVRAAIVRAAGRNTES
jgi:hypothetical protein